MKKLILMAVMAVFTLTASAQVEKGMRYGLFFSGSMSKYSKLPDAGNKFCYVGGAILEYNFTPNVYLGSGLQFGTRGTKLAGASMTSLNLIIPVNIGGRVNLSDKFALFGEVGPYVSFALKKAEAQMLGHGTIEGERFDWGLNGKVGVEFCQIQLFAGYELGLKEIWPDDAKNRSIVFGLGYLF